MNLPERTALYNLETEDTIQFAIWLDHKGVNIVKLIGIIDNYNYQYCEREIDQVIRKIPLPIIFDLEQITFATSKSCSLFLHFRKNIQEQRQAMVVASAPPNILEIFQLLRLEDQFVFVDTIEDGFKYLVKNE